MKNYFKDLLHLFYPNLCAVCEQNLLENEKTICTLCRHDLPLTNISDYKNNKVLHTFYGKVPIEKAFSLLFFRKDGITQKIIHELKYKNNEQIGVLFGNWIGEILKENKEFENVDCIIPVPLHPKKMRERGYNQVSKFGEKLSEHLKIPFVEDNLIRISSTKTQTLKSRLERFNHLDTKFTTKDISFFDNKHVLLIDDIITTGATLEVCAKEILKAKNTKISVITIAYTE